MQTKMPGDLVHEYAIDQNFHQVKEKDKVYFTV